MRLSTPVIIVVACLFILVLLFVVLSSRKKKRESVVIGEQFAKATQAEERRKAQGNLAVSPMPNEEYEVVARELGLINPVRTSLDETLGELCQRFAQSDVRARESMRTAISMDEFYTLLAFSKRAAVFAIRDRNVGWVVNGLTAISMIEKERTDFRDILMALSLLYHSASRIGADADQLFRDAAARSEAEVSDLMLDFMKQPAKHKELRASWGYDEVETTDGIGFIGWEFNDYDPSYDLKKIVIDIANFITTDKYQPTSVSVATDLPGIWLKSVDDAALDQALKAIRAGASVSARLRPNEHPAYASQLFLVFVVELANESDATTLLELAQKKRSSEYNVLGLAEQRLFCLVVASSSVMGVEAFETSESLPRFLSGISAILRRHVKEQ